MPPKRPILYLWVCLNIAVFLLWLYFVVRNASVIGAALTEGADQEIFVVSILLSVWVTYFALVAGLAQRKAGRRLFHLQLKWKRVFVLAGLFLTASSVLSIFLSQVTMDPISMISDVVKIAGALYVGMIGLVDTGVTEKGMLTPFGLVTWPDVESYDWLDDRHIVFQVMARIAGIRYKMRTNLSVDPAERGPLDSFLAQRVRQQS